MTLLEKLEFTLDCDEQTCAMLEIIIKTAYLLEYIGELERPIGMLDEVTAIIQNATDKTWEEIKEMMEVE